MSSPEIITPTPNPQAAPVIDTGLACLIMLARFHALAVDPQQIAHEFKE